MTLEKLLECSATELEAMSDIELEAHFTPMLQFTRPDRETAIFKPKKGSSTTGRQKKLSEVDQMLMNLSPEKRKFLEGLAKEQDIDLDEI